MRTKGLVSGDASSNLLQKLKSNDKVSKKSKSAEFDAQEQPVIVNVRDQIISEQQQKLREVEALPENEEPDPNEVLEERRMPEQVHD